MTETSKYRALIALVSSIYYAGGNPVLTFWLAYILTRPLGASLGDMLSQPRAYGGFGLGTVNTSTLFLGAIIVLVIAASVAEQRAVRPERRT